MTESVRYLNLTPAGARRQLAEVIAAAHAVQQADPIHRSMVRAYSLIEDARLAIEQSLFFIDQELLSMAYIFLGFAMIEINGDTRLLDMARGRQLEAAA